MEKALTMTNQPEVSLMPRERGQIQQTLGAHTISTQFYYWWGLNNVD